MSSDAVDIENAACCCDEINNVTSRLVPANRRRKRLGHIELRRGDCSCEFAWSVFCSVGKRKVLLGVLGLHTVALSVPQT